MALIANIQPEYVNIHMEDMKEEWRSLSRCNNEYEISNLGNLRCVVDYCIDRRGNRRDLTVGPIEWRELGGAPGNRYLGFYSYSWGSLYAHRLVAEAFIGEIPAKYDVCHNDNDRTNNRADNLRIDTRAGNFADKAKAGTNRLCAVRSLTVEKVQEILHKLRDGGIGEHLAEEYNVSTSMISQIRNRKLWAWVQI